MRGNATKDDLLKALKLSVPLVQHSIPINDREWLISAVVNQDSLLDIAEEESPFPFGLLLWHAAVGLAQFLSPEQVQGNSVLDLGTGVGLTAIVAKSLGGKVTQTDHFDTALALAHANSIANDGAEIHQFLGDWHSWNHRTRYDLILGADVLYSRSSHSAITLILDMNLTQSGSFLFSDPGREQATEFINDMKKSGWSILEHQLDVELGGEVQRVHVYAGCRKGIKSL